MMLIFGAHVGDHRTCIQQRPLHLPKSFMYLGLVERSGGPSNVPHRSCIKSWQDGLPEPMRCCSNASRTKSDWVRPNALERLDSQPANCAGNFTESVFIRAYGNTLLAESQDANPAKIKIGPEWTKFCW